VITALAGAPGREYRTAGDNGVRHFRALGAQDVTVAPDVREDPQRAVAALRTARLLVLPGGSPSRLLDALRSTAVGDLLAERLAEGAVLMGSSAGAMVLCAWTVLPDRRDSSGDPAVERGLGLVPGLLVLPHWSGRSGREAWLRAVERTVPPGVEVVGLPEQAGVLVEDGALTAVGSAATAVLSDGSDLPVGTTRRAA
jgi:cyanophycinase